MPMSTRPHRPQPPTLTDTRIDRLRAQLAALPVEIAAHLAYFALQDQEA